MNKTSSTSIHKEYLLSSRGKHASGAYTREYVTVLVQYRKQNIFKVSQEDSSNSGNL